MHTLFLTSSDSKLNNPTNTAAEFICELPYALELSSNYLMEIQYNNVNDSEVLIVECDIIHYSYAHENILPVFSCCVTIINIYKTLFL